MTIQLTDKQLRKALKLAFAEGCKNGVNSTLVIRGFNPNEELRNADEVADEIYNKAINAEL